MSIHDSTTKQRFWSKVDCSGDCWEWTGTDNGWGHGQLSVDGKRYYAHRLSWEWENGPIPRGLVICHHCDNPSCVNPDHLFMGTQADNIRDAARKNRMRTPGVVTPDEVRKIRRLLASGLTQAETARRMGVSNKVVNTIYHGKTYRWVE